jgi:hypothetical protein
MMRRRIVQALPWLAAALAPSLSQARSDKVWLRIRNDSQEAFTHVWQGLPQQGTDVDLGPLLPGDTSRWHALPATLAHYRKNRIQIGQRQLTHVTDQSFPGGQATLAPGHYTFSYTLQGGALRLTVTAEPGAFGPGGSHQKQ